MPTLASEAALAIIAGSDTTSTALAGAMFYMLTHPAALVRLRAELDSAAAGAALDIEIEADRLAKLPFLQAVIDETLRLQPAIPNGVQRMPPPDGGPVVVAGQCAMFALCRGHRADYPGTASYRSEPPYRFLPTHVRNLANRRCCHAHLTPPVQRDRRHFSPDPDAFLPERWLPDEGPKIAAAAGQEYKLNQGAYMPFNYGELSFRATVLPSLSQRRSRKLCGPRTRPPRDARGPRNARARVRRAVRTWLCARAVDERVARCVHPHARKA
jgi:hypothetical protein